MSYNILTDKLATRQLYGYCPSWALTWEYRKQAILKEILDSQADIIALQVIMGMGQVLQLTVGVSAKRDLLSVIVVFCLGG